MANTKELSELKQFTIYNLWLIDEIRNVRWITFRGRRSWRWSGWFKHTFRKLKENLKLLKTYQKKIAIDEHKVYQKYTKQQKRFVTIEFNSLTK
jgi:hypothetical protein